MCLTIPKRSADELQADADPIVGEAAGDVYGWLIGQVERRYVLEPVRSAPLLPKEP